MNPLEIRCPYCNVQAGKCCRNRTGYIAPIHEARIIEAHARNEDRRPDGAH
jgi:hypothetical protein